MMTGWGTVVGIEAQERIYYALAGNIAINNCLNARVLHAAVGGVEGVIEVPDLDYTSPSSFGSLEIKQRSEGSEFIGQAVDYAAGPKTSVNLVTIDGLGFERLDLIKLDVEGVEIEAIKGGRRLLAGDAVVICEEHGSDKNHTLTRYLMEETACRVFMLDPTTNKFEQVRDIAALDRIKVLSWVGYNVFATASRFWEDHLLSMMPLVATV